MSSVSSSEGEISSVSSVPDKLKSLSLYCEWEISIEVAVDWLCKGLCNIENLSRNEILEKFECFLIANKDKGWLSSESLDEECDTLIDIIYTSMVNLSSSQSSLQTCIDASDENFIKLIDFLRRFLVEITTEIPDVHQEKGISAILVKQFKFLRDLLGNEELEIWEYLSTKIHNTAYALALFVLMCSLDFSELNFPKAFLATYLVCKIGLLEQEIQVAYCDRNLKLEGSKVHNVRVNYVGIFAQVLRHDAI